MKDDRDNDLPESAARRPAVERTQDDPTLRLLAEEVQVTKEKAETGRVHVSTQTHERQALIAEDLARERVEIETIPVGRRINAVPEVRQDGDVTIVPVVEEVLVVERHLMLKEEVRIKRVRTIERHQETVILRHQDAIVTRKQGDSGKTESTAVSRTGRIAGPPTGDKPKGE
jgi:uncharacterized protein (TIGR02271 family)